MLPLVVFVLFWPSESAAASMAAPLRGFPAHLLGFDPGREQRDQFNALIELSKELTGLQDIDETWLAQVWQDAGWNLNTAINTMLDSKKRRGATPQKKGKRAGAQPVAADVVDLDAEDGGLGVVPI